MVIIEGRGIGSSKPLSSLSFQELVRKYRECATALGRADGSPFLQGAVPRREEELDRVEAELLSRNPEPPKE